MVKAGTRREWRAALGAVRIGTLREWRVALEVRDGILLEQRVVPGLVLAIAITIRLVLEVAKARTGKILRVKLEDRAEATHRADAAVQALAKDGTRRARPVGRAAVRIGIRRAWRAGLVRAAILPAWPEVLVEGILQECAVDLEQEVPAEATPKCGADPKGATQG